jgi:DNA polymerase III alpha subunit
MCNESSKSQEFCHLHVHSTYSIQDANAMPEELASRGKEMGFSSMALTDHGRMGGIPQFVEACRGGERSMKPIIGCEVYVTEDRFSKGVTYSADGAREKSTFHLTVLAQNATGYRNLLNLADIGAREGYYRFPRVDMDAISKHSDGLLVMTGCLGSEVNQAILSGDEDKARTIMSRYYDIFGKDRYFLELHNHNMAEQKAVLPTLLGLGREFGMMPVAANDVHYLEAVDWQIHEQLKQMSNISSGKSYDYERAYGAKQFWLKSDEEMARAFKPCPEAVPNTLRVADMVEDYFELDTRHLLPKVEVPDDPRFVSWKAKILPYHNKVDAYLAFLAFEGLKRLGLAHIPEYKMRLKSECENVWAMDVTAYFLAQVKVCDFMNREGILFGVRGSGVGSLLNYCLGISTLDPIKFDLMFERFLNPGRGTQYEVDFKSYTSKEYLKEFGQPLQHEAIRELRALWKAAKEDDPSLVPHGPRVDKELWILENQMLGTYLYELKNRGMRFAFNEPQLWSAWLLGLCPDKPESEMRVKQVATLPDIDTDIDSRYRDKVIGFCKTEWGADSVAPICNYGTYRARAAVKACLKTSDDFKKRYPGDFLSKLDEIGKTIPEKMLDEEHLAEDDEEDYDQIADAIKQSPEFAAWARKFPKEVAKARHILGRISNMGVHASGVIIASEPLRNHAPIEKAKKKASDDTGEGAKDEYVVALDMKRVERVGLVKWDFLGLALWTKIAVCLELLRKRGVDLDHRTMGDGLSPKQLDRIFELYRKGKTSTLFQAGSKGMKAALREVGVTHIEDLIAIFALFRPGPLEFISEYASGKKNPSSVKYADESLRDILGVTNGIPIFQEQAMRLARDLAGFNWLETQDMQKAVSKKDPEKFKKCWGLFESKASARGVSEAAISDLKNRLSTFAGYAFNRSHSASYSELSFKTAYLRAFYPTEWMAACLYVDRDRKDAKTRVRKVDLYLEECAADRIAVVNPNANDSGMDVRISGGKIILPLVFLSGVGANAVPVVEHQPYSDFRDFVFKGPKPPNKSVVKALAEGRAFACFSDVDGKSPEEVLDTFESLVRERASAEKQAKKNAQARSRTLSPLAQQRQLSLGAVRHETARDADELDSRPMRGMMAADDQIDNFF